MFPTVGGNDAAPTSWNTARVAIAAKPSHITPTPAYAARRSTCKHKHTSTQSNDDDNDVFDSDSDLRSCRLK